MSNKHVTSVSVQNGHKRDADKSSGRNGNLLKADSDQIDLDALLKAVLDVSEDGRQVNRPQSAFSSGYSSHGEAENGDLNSSEFALSNRQIQQSRRTSNNNRPADGTRRNNLLNKESRQNLSFTNEKVYDIDRENERLLKEITKGQRRKKLSRPTNSNKIKPVKVMSSSELNRQKYQEKIERENLALLNRLEKVKPSKGLAKKDLLNTNQQTSTQSKRSKNQSTMPRRRPGSSSTIYSSRDSSRASSVSDLRCIESRCASSNSSRLNSSRSSNSVSGTLFTPTRLQQTKYAKPIWEPGW